MRRPCLAESPLVEPEVEKAPRPGVAVRHTRTAWQAMNIGDGALRIDLQTTGVVRAMREILSRERIVSSSLHGLILADSSGSPRAWLESDSGCRPIELVDSDGRRIGFGPHPLLNRCPLPEIAEGRSSRAPAPS